MIRTDDGKLVSYSFDSWGEFVDASQGPCNPTVSFYRASRKPAERSTWDLSIGWAETLKLAETGWLGADQEIKALSEKIGTIFGSQAETIEFERSEVGEEYDIGAVLQGVPECMWKPTPVMTRSRGFFRIVVPLGGHCGIDAKAFMYQGALACALVSILEANGQTCEVIGSHYSESSHGGEGRRNIAYTINLKTGGEALDLPFLAMALANVNSHRRLAFSLWETDPKANQIGCGHQGYGYTRDAKITQADFNLPSVQDVSSYGYDPTARLAEWLRAALKEKEIAA